MTSSLFTTTYRLLLRSTFDDAMRCRPPMSIFSHFRNCENVKVNHFDISGIPEMWKRSLCSFIRQTGRKSILMSDRRAPFPSNDICGFAQLSKHDKFSENSVAGTSAHSPIQAKPLFSLFSLLTLQL